MFFPLQVHAGYYSLFPIFRYEKDGKVELDAVAPIFAYHTSPDSRLTAVRPLFSSEYNLKTNSHHVDVVWPIATYRYDEKGDESRKRLLITPFIGWSRTASPEKWTTQQWLAPLFFKGKTSDGARYCMLFPVFLMGKKATFNLLLIRGRNADFFAIFPLFGTFTNFMGKDNVTFYLWPLFSKSEKNDERNWNILWPIFGYSKKEDEITGVRAFPFFVWRKLGDDAKRINFLWPLGHYYNKEEKDRTDRSYAFFPLFWQYDVNDVKISYIFPIRACLSSPTMRGWALCWPLLSYWEKTQTSGKGFNVLWRIGRFCWGGEEKRYEVLPLFGYRRLPEKTSWYALGPLISHKKRQSPEYTYRHTFVFPFYLNKRKEWDNGDFESVKFFLPFIFHSKSVHGDVRKSSLWPLWYTKSEGIERNYASFWRLWEKKVSADGVCETKFMGKVYYTKRTGERLLDKEINTLIFNYRKRPHESGWNILGGVLGTEKKNDTRKVKILFIPFKI